MDKIYCGSGKEIDGKYGKMLKLSFSKTDIETLLANLNEKGWVNLIASERKEVGKFGETHSITVDTWKPEWSKQTAIDNPTEYAETPKRLKYTEEELDASEIPF